MRHHPRLVLAGSAGASHQAWKPQVVQECLNRHATYTVTGGIQWPLLATQAEQVVSLKLVWAPSILFVHKALLSYLSLSGWSKNQHFEVNIFIISDYFLLIVISKFTPLIFTQRFTSRIGNWHLAISDFRYWEKLTLVQVFARYSKRTISIQNQLSKYLMIRYTTDSDVTKRKLRALHETSKLHTPKHCQLAAAKSV